MTEGAAAMMRGGKIAGGLSCAWSCGRDAREAPVLSSLDPSEKGDQRECCWDCLGEEGGLGRGQPAINPGHHDAEQQERAHRKSCLALPERKEDAY